MDAALIKYGSIIALLLAGIGGLYYTGYKSGVNAELVKWDASVAKVAKDEDTARNYQRQTYAQDLKDNAVRIATLSATINQLHQLASATVPSGGSCTHPGYSFTDEQYYELAELAATASQRADDYAARINTLK